jgi:phosphocarrier protein HPr
MIPQTLGPPGEAHGSAMLTNAVGLHARPVVKLTQLAKGFAARIAVAAGPEGPWTDAKSPVKLMRIKAVQGDVLHVRADGTDAQDAVAAVLALIGRRFDEE